MVGGELLAACVFGAGTLGEAGSKRNFRLIPVSVYQNLPLFAFVLAYFDVLGLFSASFDESWLAGTFGVFGGLPADFHRGVPAFDPVVSSVPRLPDGLGLCRVVP